MELAKIHGIAELEATAPITVIGTGGQSQHRDRQRPPAAATLLKMSVSEVRNRATVNGAVEIGRHPGVVQITFLAPLERLDACGLGRSPANTIPSRSSHDVTPFMLRPFCLSACSCLRLRFFAEPQLGPEEVPLRKSSTTAVTTVSRTSLASTVRTTARSAAPSLHGDPSSGVVGDIAVIRSEDLVTWEEVARFTRPGVDLRDPKLTPSPLGLRVYAVAGEISEAGILQYRTASWSSSDGRNWSGPREMAPGYIFWRPKWHAGKFYVPAYLRRPGYCSVDLLVSEDGDHWRLHSTPLPPTDVEGESLWANECDLLFLPEGKSLLFSRRNQGGGTTNPNNENLGGFRRGYVGLSETPTLSSGNRSMKISTSTPLPHWSIGGKIYLAGRDMVRLPNGATETCRLWELT